MSIPPRLRTISLLVVALGAGAYIFCPVILLYPYDAWRLARLTKRLKNSDRVVVTCPYQHDTRASVELGKGDSRKLVEALASSASIRPPLFAMYPADWSIRATFFSSTNVVGFVDTCANAFLIPGSESPFEDGTEVLFSVLQPAARALATRTDEKVAEH
jgi:hypothetical protein